MTNRTYLLATMTAATLLQACSANLATGDSGTGEGGTTTLSGAGGGTTDTGGGSASSSSSGGTGGSGLAPLEACADGQAMVDKIAGAQKGDVIKLDVCTIQGPLVIPPGVTVQGAGKGLSRITTKAGTFAIHMLPGEPAARLSDVSVISSGTAAIAAKGAGAIELVNVEVDLTRGVGIAVEALSSLSMKEVSISGPVTPRSARAFPANVLPKEAATHGLVVLDVPSVTIEATTVMGFADYGAIFVDSNLDWSKGGSFATLGTGLYVSGGAAKLDALSLCGAFSGNRKLPAYNGVFAKGAAVTSTKLQVCDSEGMGLLHVGATAHHEDIVGTGNLGPALWAQQSTSFEIAGASNVLDKNRFAGLVLVDVAKVHLVNTKIANTEMVSRPYGAAGASVELGDGIQLIRSAAAVTFESVSLTNNAHTGLQIDVGPNELDSPLFHMKWMGVTVESSGAAFGAICQGSPNNVPHVWGPGVLGWDTGILRSGAAAVNDGLLIDPNELVGLIDPNEIPSPTSLLKGEGLKSLGVNGL